VIEEVSPEANRQKATVQVKVKVISPDEYLRPEMNASVAFFSPQQNSAQHAEPAKPVVVVRRERFAITASSWCPTARGQEGRQSSRNHVTGSQNRRRIDRR